MTKRVVIKNITFPSTAGIPNLPSPPSLPLQAIKPLEAELTIAYENRPLLRALLIQAEALQVAKKILG